jgi:hypothetical protein
VFLSEQLYFGLVASLAPNRHPNRHPGGCRFTHSLQMVASRGSNRPRSWRNSYNSHRGTCCKLLLLGRISTLGCLISHPQVIKTRLESLRKISKEATAYYCSLFERIPEDSREVAQQGFTWVLGSGSHSASRS